MEAPGTVGHGISLNFGIRFHLQPSNKKKRKKVNESRIEPYPIPKASKTKDSSKPRMGELVAGGPGRLQALKKPSIPHWELPRYFFTTNNFREVMSDDRPSPLCNKLLERAVLNGLYTC